jgi:hypothetical protein
MGETMVETDLDNGLRTMTDKGFIRFSIKANDTDENQRVHEAFKEFCNAECDGNYTQGIKILLKNYDNDYRFDSLYELITHVRDEFNAYKAEHGKVEKDDGKENEGMF